MKSIRLGGVLSVVLSVVGVAGSAQAAGVAIPGLEPTGVSAAGVTLASGKTDPHYTLTATALPAVTCTNGTYPLNGTWIANGTSSSNGVWDCLTADTSTNWPGGDYTFETTFSMTGLDPTTASISVSVAADNSVGINLNGNTEVVVETTFNQYDSPTNFVVSSGFQAGTNALDFVVDNFTATPSPIGLYVLSISGTANLIAPTLTALTTPTSNTQPTVSGTNAFPGATVTVYINGVATSTTVTATATGTFSVSLATPLAAGTYSVTVVQTSASATSPASNAQPVTIYPNPPSAPVFTTPTANEELVTSTPTISGTGEAGSTVIVKQGLVVICTATVAANGTWTCTSAVLLDGTHAVTATETDPLAHTSAASSLSFTTDTGKPAISSPTAAEEIVTATPTIHGTGAPGTSISVKSSGGTVLCTATVAAGGTWSCVSSSLTNGSYTVSATETDASGNTLTSSSVSFTVNATLPAITAPTNGQVLTTAKPTFTGTAAPGETVTVSQGATVLCTTTAASPSGAWTCTSSTLTDGSHTVTATETDGAGDTQTSAPITFLTSTSPPTIVVPTNNEVVVTSKPGISGNATPGSTVTVTAGGATLCTTVTGGTGVWTCTSATLADGTYHATATETDGQGDQLSSTVVAFTVDTVKPAITAPTANQALVTSTPTISGTAAPGASVAVDDGASTLCTALANASGAWSCTPSALANGAYAVTAVETDPAGDTLTSSTVPFTVNSSAPTITAPTNGQVLVSATVKLTGTAPPGSTVTVADASGTLCTATANPSSSSTPGAWTCTVNSLASGSYTATATAADGAGNKTSPSSPVSFTIDTAAPVVTSPTTGQALATNTPTITGTAAPGSTVTVTTSGGTLLCTVTASTTDGTWSCPVPSGDLTDGPQSISVVSKDSDGSSSPTTTATFVTDTQPPTLSILTGPANPTNQTTAVFTISQADPPPSSGLATPLCSLDSAPPTPCPISGSTITLAGVSQGSHVLGVVAVDNAGNESAPATWAWTVTTSPPPTPTISAPTANQELKTSTPTLSGSAGPGNTVTVTTSTGTVLCTATAGSTGSWSCTSATLVDGSYTITASATDAAHNASAASAPVTFAVDTAAPTAVITAGPALVTTDTSATFTVTESDPSPSSGLVAPLCSLNGAPITCNVTNTTGTGSNLVLTISVSAVPAGVDSFVVTAVDAAGNEGASAPYPWTVSAIAPVAPTIASPTSGQVLTTTTPPISGNAPAGNTVTVTSGGTVLCTAIAAAVTGAWTCTPTVPLGEGQQTISATDTNSVGNTSSATTVSVIVNAAPPDTLIVSGPPAESNSTSATFTFSSNESPVTYQCGLDGAVFTTCSNPTTIASLADGSHTLQVRAVDSSGNVDPTPASETWTVDTVAPTAPTFTTPEANSAVATTTPVVSGTAEPGSTVSVTQSGFAVCTAAADANGNWTCTPAAALAQGSNTLSATATDAAGNVGPAATVTFTVDTVAPTVTITSGPPATSSSSSATFVFASNETGVTYQCTLDSGTAAPCADPATFTGLSDGSHTLSVVAVDAAGNVSTTPATETWTVDTTSTVLAITTPGNGADVSTSSPTIGGTAPSGPVSVSVNGTVICANAVVTGGQWTCPDTGLANGSYTVSVTGPGTDGGPATVSSTFTVVTTPPDTTITAEPPLKSNSSTATFQFTSSEAGSTFECSLDGAAFAPCSTPDVLSSLADGSHTFAVEAVDAAGNVDPTPASDTWQVNTTLPAAPMLTSPGNGSFISTTTPTYVGTAPAGDTVTVQVDGTTACTATAAADGSWTCTPAAALSAGTHAVTLTATDGFGNTSPETDSSFTIETGAPDTTIVSGPPATTSSTSATFVFSSNESDVSYQCSLDDGGAFVPCTNPDTLTGLVSGSYTIDVEAVNGAGIADPTPASYSWTVNTGLTGVFAVNQPGNGSLVGQSEPTFSGTGNAGDTVTINVDGTVACTAVVAADGTWTCTATAPEANGQHQVSATSVTGTGSQDGQIDLSFGIDTTPPTTTIVSGPPHLGAPTTATFEFSSDESGVTYQCSLDGASATPCSNPDLLSGLANGSHTLTVAAVDGAGNVDPSPPSYTWVVGSSSSSTSSSASSSSGSSSGSTSTSTSSGSTSSSVSSTGSSASTASSTGSAASGSSGTHSSTSGTSSSSTASSTSGSGSVSTASSGSSGSTGTSGTHGGSSGSTGTHGSTTGAVGTTASTSSSSSSSGSISTGSTSGTGSGSTSTSPGSSGSTGVSDPGTVKGGGCGCGQSGGSLFDLLTPLMGLGLLTRRRPRLLGGRLAVPRS